MTNVRIDPFAREVQERETMALKAAGLLHSAAERIEQAPEGEGLEDRNLRLRGAAVLAHAAGLEVAVIAGWLDAADTIAEKSGDSSDAGGILNDEGGAQ
jgi:hypothetical protein